MAYKFKSVTKADPTLMLQALRDFLVNDCGWTDETPTGQDDAMGAGSYPGIIGYFLRSSGEAADNDIVLHLFTAQPSNFASMYWDSMLFPATSYLSAAIDASVTTIPLVDSTRFSAVDTPFNIRINDEVMTVSSVGTNQLTVSVRGVAGTTAAAHSSGDVVVSTRVAALAEVYAYRDLDTALLSSTASSSVGKDSATNVPGLSGYGDNRFNFHTFLKITSGTQAGKMRPVEDYAATNGDFTYLPFKEQPGTVDVDLVSLGFLPTHSRRDPATTEHRWPRIEMAQDGNDTVFWFYGSKDSFVVVSKYNSGYDAFHAGTVIPYAAKDNAVTTSAIASGAAQIPVDDITIFEVGEKFRILSQDTGDWADNESRTSPEVDLDPEEIPSEEFIVQSIASGTGTAGTITTSVALHYTYAAGAVVGEDPRPNGASSKPRYITTNQGADIMTGQSVWAPVYSACNKADQSSHMSHRQRWRAVHSSTDKNVPLNGSYARYALYDSKISVNAGGNTRNNGGVAYTNELNSRPIFGLLSLENAYTNYTQYGIFPAAKGVLPNIWWVPLDSSSNTPFSAAEEDTYKARWGSQYEEFRLFKQRASSVNYAACGPEVA